MTYREMIIELLVKRFLTVGQAIDLLIEFKNQILNHYVEN